MCVATQAGKPKAYFYLDPYSRPAEKRGGAWMAGVVNQVCVRTHNSVDIGACALVDSCMVVGGSRPLTLCVYVCGQ